MEQVVWRPVNGYEGRYEVSSSGVIRSLDVTVRCRCNGIRVNKGKVLPYRANNRGYLTVDFTKDNVTKRFLVHRVVAEAFIDNPKCKPQVNHIDGDITNNAYQNLEWVTDNENKIHSSIYVGGSQRPKKAVKVICMESGDTIFFDGLREAERALSLEHKCSLNVLNGKQIVHKGYYLAYV